MREFKIKQFLAVVLFFSASLSALNAETYLRVNQLGYLPDDTKTAVIITDESFYGRPFEVKNQSGEPVYTGYLSHDYGPYLNFPMHFIADFSSLSTRGKYRVQIDNYRSEEFLISKSVYVSVTKGLLRFYQIQRCGLTAPLYHDPCHLKDATEVINAPAGIEQVDLTGGWHDAGDYTKFFITTAFSTYLMLLTYEAHPVFFNNQDADYKSNLLDEAKIGLDWLTRAHYQSNRLIIQLQNKNDQTVGWRLPEEDPLSDNRPAYDYPAQTHCGLAVATFALASDVFDSIGEPEFARLCKLHALQLWDLAQNQIPAFSSGPDSVYVDQSAWDNLALGAVELYRLTGDQKYLKAAITYAESENPISWVSWGDLGGFAYARLAEFYPEVMERLAIMLSNFDAAAGNNPFGYPLPNFPWGSASIQMGAAVMALLHLELTDSREFLPLAIMQRDFVLGKNPHGVSFIGSYGSRYAKYFHHQVSRLRAVPLRGALASGYIAKVTHEQSGVRLALPDPFDRFQHQDAVYYDDAYDYLCNEPTISNNALALYVFAWFADPKTFKTRNSIGVGED